MTHSLAIKKGYKKLVEDLADIIESGRSKVLEALVDIRNQTYWSLGERMAKFQDIGDKKAASDLVNSLAADLEISSSTLYRALQFFNTYPEGLPDKPDLKKLSWAIHSELLPIKDVNERGFYLQRAAQENWSTRTMRRALRGKLYQKENLKASGAKAWQLDRPGAGIHSYLATLEKVVDGDTLDVKIDLGFDVWVVKRLRLRGIDTPEIKFSQGQKATRFVKRVLKGVEFVVVKTYKTDRYARYVADVFYDSLSGEKDKVISSGNFLNQDLLDQGLARPAFWA
ncbi:MAG: thermonuclease family protein [Deltaproteobacteria bacterium]|nr:thermonuclease family protein [Deltaproteobacteria bacterium]